MLASKIAKNTEDFISHHTSVSIEKAVLRLLGVAESYQGKPVVDAVVATLPLGGLSHGICPWLARGLPVQQTTPAGLCLKIAEGGARFQDFPEIDSAEADRILAPIVTGAISRLEEAKEARIEEIDRYPEVARPFKYVRVTGDAELASRAVEKGAHCLEVEASASLEKFQKDLRGLRLKSV